jgi:hypothetical protein
MIKQSATVVSALALAVLAGGCLVTSGKNMNESGMKVSSSTLRQVELGETTGAWLFATLGEPTECTKVEGDPCVEIYRYDHITTSRSSGTIFLLFATGSKKQVSERTYFELTDGVVTKYWKED